jgi:transcription elongation GreA/GreB family factor
MLAERMSKAFTKEDDAAGFTMDPPSVVQPPAWVSERAAAAARARLREPGLAPVDEQRLGALLHANVVKSAGGAQIAVGAEVRLRGGRGERTVVLTSASEVGLVPNAVSTGAPLGRALIGMAEGDLVEVEGARGVETYEVLLVSW